MTEPPPEFRSYYGRPVLKEPVWKWQIPLYLFFGGLAGATAGLTFSARRRGLHSLAIRSNLVNLAAVSVSPPLLIADLGRPARFLNMLRVLKVTSPMSVGTWIISTSGVASGASLAADVLELPRVRAAAEAVAAALGPFLSTYTAVLVADTAIPVWHEARRELPFVFAGGSAASAGAATGIVTPSSEAGPARRLAVGGALLQLAATELMERRLGPVGEPYHTGDAGRYASWGKRLTAAGAVLTGVGGGRRAGRVAGGALLLAGSLADRWAVFTAGFASARDPKYTIVPQRERLQAAMGR
jgi:formate-dependent nitrite reductase membrane component NrfD